jgi:phenylacetate-coenzyme A ligase PaaK-like adenylate-forming protein
MFTSLTDAGKKVTAKDPDSLKETNKEIEQKVRTEMNRTLGISTRIKSLEPRTIAPTEGKTRHVIDRRKP